MKKICKERYTSKMSLFSDFLNKNSTYKKCKKLAGKCLLISKCDKVRFFAISGSEHFEKSIAYDIKTIVKNGFRFVKLNEKVRCYFGNNSHSYITYGQIKKWLRTKLKNSIQIVNCDDIVFIKNRLCSCCERKMLSEIYKKRFKIVKFYIKCEPCENCKIAIKKYSPKIQVEFYKHYKDNLTDRIKSLAQMIKNEM